MRNILLCLALLGSLNGWGADYNTKFDPARDIETDFNAAVKDAQAADKRLFIEMGTEWCGDCNKLSELLSDDAEFKQIMDDHFIVLKVRAWSEGKNGDFERNLAEIGCVPSVLIADKNGKSLMFRHGICFEEKGSLNREIVKDFLLEATTYELPDLTYFSDDNPETKVTVRKGSLLTIPTGTLGPLKGFRIMGRTLGSSPDANAQTKFGVGGYPFGRRQRMGLLDKPLNPNEWVEFEFSEPVNGNYFKIGELNEAIEVSGLELIRSDAVPALADVTEDQLIRGKINYREYRISGWNLPDPTGQTAALESTETSFITELSKDATGRCHYGLIESSGFVKIDTAGEYTFKLYALGQAKFRLGDKTVINQPPYISNEDYIVTLNLQAGFYPYQVLFRPSREGGALAVFIKNQGREFTPLESDMLYIEKPQSAQVCMEQGSGRQQERLSDEPQSITYEELRQEDYFRTEALRVEQYNLYQQTH
jgi:thiol-disulfide isomerase/thioredoxin